MTFTCVSLRKYTINETLVDGGVFIAVIKHLKVPADITRGQARTNTHTYTQCTHRVHSLCTRAFGTGLCCYVCTESCMRDTL